VPPLSRRANTAADDRTGRRRAHARMQCQEQLGCCSIGPVDREAPADLVGISADLGAMAGEDAFECIGDLVDRGTRSGRLDRQPATTLLIRPRRVRVGD